MHVRLKSPRPNQIVARLLELIEAEGLQPGDRLPSERELAKRFGASRPAVREAVIALQSMRLVEIRANSGMYIRQRELESSIETLVLLSNHGIKLPRRELEQSIELRSILERQAAELAARRATFQDLADLRATLDDGAACIERGESLEELDEQFHLTIARATQNSMFFRLMQTFLMPLRSRRMEFFSDPNRCRASQAMHEKLFAAIAAGEPAQANLLMKEHVGQAENYYSHPAEKNAGDSERMTTKREAPNDDRNERLPED